jgi:hypothetical protein
MPMYFLFPLPDPPPPHLTHPPLPAGNTLNGLSGERNVTENVYVVLPGPLFLSTFGSFKKSCVLMTGVSLVDKTCKYTPCIGNKKIFCAKQIFHCMFVVSFLSAANCQRPSNYLSCSFSWTFHYFT